AATNASFSLPLTALAAAFSSASGAVTVSRCTDSERSRMSGLSGASTGRMRRAVERASPTPVASEPRGWRATVAVRAAARRAGPVEALDGDRGGQVEQVAHRARLRRADPAQVVAEVEMRVDGPPRRGGDERCPERPLAEAGDEARAPLDAVGQPGPVRWAV